MSHEQITQDYEDLTEADIRAVLAYASALARTRSTIALAS
jgi:uncharacterized protein (DUF433 family)